MTPDPPENPLVLDMEDAKALVEAADTAALVVGFAEEKPALGEVAPEDREFDITTHTYALRVSENRRPDDSTGEASEGD